MNRLYSKTQSSLEPTWNELHDVRSKQHNDEAHRSFEVNSEKISNNFSRPKGGPTNDSPMSETDHKLFEI